MQAAEPVKIGVIAPLTGSQANIGTGVVNGIKAAAKRINAQGGVNGSLIELIIYDDRNSPDEGVSAARRLIYEDKVKVILGSIGSSVTAAIQQLSVVRTFQNTSLFSRMTVLEDVRIGAHLKTGTRKRF